MTTDTTETPVVSPAPAASETPAVTQTTIVDEKSTKSLIVLKPSKAFWRIFAINVLFNNAIMAIGLLAVGITIGFEGKFVFDMSRVSEAVGYLFGGPEQFFLFLLAFGVIALLVLGANRASRNGNHGMVTILCVIAIAAAGLAFTKLEFGANIVPLFIYVIYTLFTSALTTAALTAVRQRANH